MPAAHWLLKTEPSTYSFARLVADGGTAWNGVRNHQARNFLRGMRKGDLALIYHSGEDKAVVGVAAVAGAPYPDPDPAKKGDWLQVDLEPRAALRHPVPLARIKATPALAKLLLVTHSRLSVMPVSPSEFALLERMSRAPASPAKG